MMPRWVAIAFLLGMGAALMAAYRGYPGGASALLFGAVRVHGYRQ
jgi:hypothetical protein